MGLCSTLFGGRAANADEARRLVRDGAVLLDVRSPEEFGAGHLQGAVNLPVQVLEERLAELGPRDQAVVVYCGSGIRSARAARTLRRAGYTVVDIGAMTNWPEGEGT